MPELVQCKLIGVVIMREALRNFDWFTYGLSEEDFDYSIRLVKEMIEARKILLEQEKNRIFMEYEEEAYDEIISDIAHYTWVDSQYLWNFCLWRIQGIFERIIIQDFLSHKDDNELRKLNGLKSILIELKKEEYRINRRSYNEVLNWASLRNALSHSPPEMFRPLILKEEDLLEYALLLREILTDLEVQKRKLQRR